MRQLSSSSDTVKEVVGLIGSKAEEALAETRRAGWGGKAEEFLLVNLADKVGCPGLRLGAVWRVWSGQRRVVVGTPSRIRELRAGRRERLTLSGSQRGASQSYGGCGAGSEGKGDRPRVACLQK